VTDIGTRYVQARQAPATRRDIRVDESWARTLARVMRSVRRERSPYARITRAWEQIVGADLAPRTRVLSFAHGRLVIGVASAPLRGELVAFRAADLLAALQASPRGRDVVELDFKLFPDLEA